MTTETLDHDVLIVGAGFSGIGAAVALQRAGIEDYALVDNATGFGGTWFWNRYPGIAVDIPSFSYQYSFEQRPDWSRSYAKGAELRAYAERCAAKYDLPARTSFGQQVTSATFDESGAAWELGFADGSVRTARHVIDATGVLTIPKRPDIPGVEDFAGVTMHTARWDDSVDLRGKRVAIIGTGASAIQVIPEIAPQVEHLTVFQRTPIWCLPKLDVALPGVLKQALAHVPGAKLAARAASQAFVEVTFPLAVHFHQPLHLATPIEPLAKAYLRSQVHDPVLRDKLTPRYAVGCKRPSFHNEYLATYNRANVTLETDPIAAMTATGLTTATGTEHAFDVLILATGFKVYDSGNVPKYPVLGRDGTDLEAWWLEHRFRAYQGVSVPGFPNYHLMFGPYGYNGASYFTLVETQAHHIARLLRHARKQDAATVEVTSTAEAAFFEEMLRRRGSQIFWQESCATANSYYFDRNGDVPFRPALSAETVWRSRRFPLSDYAFAPAPSAPARARRTRTASAAASAR